MKAEYDFSKLREVKGKKYADYYPKNSTYIPLDSNLVKKFPDIRSINQALKLVLELKKLKLKS